MALPARITTTQGDLRSLDRASPNAVVPQCKIRIASPLPVKKFLTVSHCEYAVLQILSNFA